MPKVYSSPRSMIDAHSHMPINDYLPQYKACDIVEDYMGGGITSMLLSGRQDAGSAFHSRWEQGAGHSGQGDVGKTTGSVGQGFRAVP